MNRRTFLQITAGLGACAPTIRLSAAESDSLAHRIRGLLVGSLYGDALGGPIEFQNPDQVHRLTHPPKRWGDAEVLDEKARREAESRLDLRSYRDLRPTPEPYAHWTTNAPPGTVTDDSRHKMILISALRTARDRNHWPVTPADLARAYIDWPESLPPPLRARYASLAAQWLEEWLKAARWCLGMRSSSDALPPERMWSGLATCAGQMALLPLAGLFPALPERAYQAAYDLGFVDNGIAKDLNSSVVAGLAAALRQPSPGGSSVSAWAAIETAMRHTDPYRYGRVPWVQRSVDRWLDTAGRFSLQADGRPGRLFAELEQEFRSTIKWEAQVPFTVTFALLALCPDDALAALQLSLEWGNDTDSDAQLLGAFLGALHGADLFPTRHRNILEERLREDYGESLESWVDLLVDLERLGRQRPLIQAEG